MSNGSTTELVREIEVEVDNIIEDEETNDKCGDSLPSLIPLLRLIIASSDRRTEDEAISLDVWPERSNTDTVYS